MGSKTLPLPVASSAFFDSVVTARTAPVVASTRVRVSPSAPVDRTFHTRAGEAPPTTDSTAVPVPAVGVKAASFACRAPVVLAEAVASTALRAAPVAAAADTRGVVARPAGTASRPSSTVATPALSVWTA